MADAPLQPMRVAWDPAFETGHARLDAQHRGLLALCDELADLCMGGHERDFDDRLPVLQALAAEHFAAELDWLHHVGDEALDDHRAGCGEFGFLMQDIATTAHFNRLELQRFLALWWLGHVAEPAARFRALQPGGTAPG